MVVVLLLIGLFQGLSPPCYCGGFGGAGTWCLLCTIHLACSLSPTFPGFLLLGLLGFEVMFLLARKVVLRLLSGGGAQMQSPGRARDRRGAGRGQREEGLGGAKAGWGVLIQHQKIRNYRRSCSSSHCSTAHWDSGRDLWHEG